MPRFAASLLLLVALTFVAEAAVAQAGGPDSAQVEATRRILRSDLRNFVTVQEMYFAENSTYAPSLRAVAKYYTPSRGTTITVLAAGDGGFSVVAVHEAVPDLVCGIFSGDAPRPFGEGEEGRVVCKGP